jgi:hypothetical protein
MASEDGLGLVKGMSRADVIVPKLPLIDAETGKRQDGRKPNEVRQLCRWRKDFILYFVDHDLGLGL